jgi:hypothetical protein
MKVGITGHQRLKDASAWQWVKQEIEKVLMQMSRPIIGITSLAIGADQTFAQSIIENGGILNLVIPFAGYENKFEHGYNREKYQELFNLASEVEILPRAGSDEESYYEAGKRVVDISDILIAVWDDKPAAGLGGTGDIVKYAKDVGKSIVHINPITRSIMIY